MKIQSYCSKTVFLLLTSTLFLCDHFHFESFILLVERSLISVLGVTIIAIIVLELELEKSVKVIQLPI